jgi:hypothetical protein
MSIDDIFQTPPADLIEKLTELRDTRAAIESKEDIIRQLLDVYVQQGGELAEQIGELGAASGLGSLRKQILHVMGTKRDEMEFVTLPVVVHPELVARGNRKVSLDNVRVTMKRMADDNELERPIPEEPLAFALPGTVDIMPEGLLQALKAGQRR